MIFSLRSLTSAIIILAALTAFPSYAAQQYYCHGAYGDATDNGLWDWVFSATSKQDAINQAKQKYMKNTPGAYVNVFECR